MTKSTVADSSSCIVPELMPFAAHVESLVLDTDNAVQHDEESIQGISRSLEEFGQDQPLVARESDRVVIKGNGRLQAARKLGWTHVAVILVPDDQAQSVARSLADNRSSEHRRWDKRKLNDLLEFLRKTTPKPVERLGWSTRELDAICEAAHEPKSKKPERVPPNGGIEAIDRLVFGRATAISRADKPLRHWRSEGVLEGEVLDLGSGLQGHEFEKYDVFECPSPKPLMRQWDRVMCSFVLNVQPAEHLIWQLSALIYWLVRPGGRALIAVRSEEDQRKQKASGSVTSVAMTREQWREYIGSQWQEVKEHGDDWYGYECLKEK